MINEHNARYEKGEVTWSMGINQFTDLVIYQLFTFDYIKRHNDTCSNKTFFQLFFSVLMKFLVVFYFPRRSQFVMILGLSRNDLKKRFSWFHSYSTKLLTNNPITQYNANKIPIAIYSLFFILHFRKTAAPESIVILFLISLNGSHDGMLCWPLSVDNYATISTYNTVTSAKY